VFITVPAQFNPDIQSVVLILNTLVLIAMLIVAEVMYAETPKSKRAHLTYFYPLAAVCIGLVAFAAYLEIGGK
jgi:hypothetical protein